MLAKTDPRVAQRKDAKAAGDVPALSQAIPPHYLIDPLRMRLAMISDELITTQARLAQANDAIRSLAAKNGELTARVAELEGNSKPATAGDAPTEPPAAETMRL